MPLKRVQLKKKLAAQFIAKYFKNLPELHENAIEVLLDLCEDVDMATRVHAIRGVASVSKDAPEELPRMGDILVQLLQADEVLELDTVKHALESLLRVDIKGTLGALFGRIIDGEDNQREKAITFLRDKVIAHAKELLHPDKEAEEYLTEQIKKVLEDVNGEEFRIFIDILRNLKIFQGQNSHVLLDLIADQADINSNFQPDKVDNVERLISCLSMAVPFYKIGASDAKFLNYISTKVLPIFDKLEDSHKLSLLKLLAEMSSHCKPEEPKRVIEPIYELVKTHIPNKTPEGSDAPKINFTYIECLLYIFHQMAAKSPSSLFSICGLIVSTDKEPPKPDEESKAKQEDLKTRLELLERNTQLYVKQLNQTLTDLKKKKTNYTRRREETTSKSRDSKLSIAHDKEHSNYGSTFIEARSSAIGPQC